MVPERRSTGDTRYNPGIVADYRFSWHPTTRDDDLDACLSIQPANIGGGLIGPAAARKIWHELIDHPALLSAVVTCDPPDGESTIAAFGAAVFVAAGFIDSEIANPRPRVNDRLMALLAADRSVLLGWDEIAQANATTGISVMSMYGSFSLSDANAKMFSILTGSFIQLSAGYNIRRILWEPVGEIERGLARSAGVHRFLAEFPDLDRDLVMVDPQSAAQVPASLAPLVFASRKPELRLTRSDRELLTAALKGLTDAELAAAMGIRLSAVKARWRSIFSRFSETRPDMIQDAPGDTARGPQKRHHIVEYVRLHPEELRPWPAVQSGASRK